MTRIAEAGDGPAELDRIMAHRPEIAEHWLALDAAMRFQGVLSPQLKEEVRRTLATGIGCRACASLGAPQSEHPDVRESAAVEFAKAVATDHLAIDDAQFRGLLSVFTPEETVELMQWTCFMIASQMIGALVATEPNPEHVVNAYNEWWQTEAAAWTAPAPSHS